MQPLEQSQGTDVGDIERTVDRVAIDIYNELPIVEGYVVNKDQNLYYIDIGNEKGIRKGSKCVVFREPEDIFFHDVVICTNIKKCVYPRTMKVQIRRESNTVSCVMCDIRVESELTKLSKKCVIILWTGFL